VKSYRGLVAVALLGLAARSVGAGGPMLTVIHTFTNTFTDGGLPQCVLVEAIDGNFYGTTPNGGTNGGHGIVFKITPAGAFTTLHQFGLGTADGREPAAGLIQGSDSNFYGTAQLGGTNNLGTVFKITAAGTLTNLYQFGGTNGASPLAALVQASDGLFYGTTFAGGTNNAGTVFKITSAGVLTTLYQFSGGADGGQPDSKLVQGTDGNLYGTTASGGLSNNCINGCGTVFKITPAGALTTLYRFDGSDGSFPHGGIVPGNDGDFYGTTYTGGGGGFGTVYKITGTGGFTPLQTFSVPPGGRFALAGLALGCDGNFYGATTSDGSSNSGALFMITPTGALTTFDVFTNAFFGTQPRGGLAQGFDGNFYGTANHGGSNDLGAIYKLLISFSLPANRIGAIKRSGTNIVMTVPSVGGETYQLQFRDSLAAASNWLNAPLNPITSIGGPLPLTNSIGPTQRQRFYRLQITP
jgi:uncharacterized repeat protein (TIGR03803 family)